MKFTSEQIHEAQTESGNIFPVLIRQLKLLGVVNFITFVTDGHTDYFDDEKESITSEATHDLLISENTNAEKFLERLKLHQNGGTNFQTFCQDCAENGIDCWIVDLQKMTCTYYDKSGKEILVEKIPTVPL
ncbi:MULTISPECIES: DUF1398 domain-containing protein [Chryseobacterium]|uniref:Phage envelope protein n=1 Tax=Chryseobacterium salivictor TaxID=2547600 RepID=A0A4P6ZH79_9FLAO|nr:MULTISPECIES: DUF1398 family protein [Chryseobacterium]MDQ0475654.1 uncharacterized protein YbcV (DUF1398 family) [Chryseobacterium sp. MDT2-18]QBO59081.1 hypothetical protein NBC122_02276 [Chryseobacterium salivictor]